MVDFEAFKTLVERIKVEHPIWFGMESDSIPEQSDITEAEINLGISLPTDYINFVSEYGGGYFAFSNVFSLEKRSDWNLVDLNNKYREIVSGHVLISENNLGDFYGFKITDGICGPEIYYYDHEVAQWQKSSYENLFEYLKVFAISRS